MTARERASEAMGFGEPLRGRATTMGNPYARFTTIPRENGFDVVVGSKGTPRTGDGRATVVLEFRNPEAGGER